MKIAKVVIPGLIAIVLVCFFTGSAAPFPTEAITIICPYGAGGVTDLTTRALAEAAEKHFGQKMIVENVTGGGGSIAYGRLVTKRPDGYYLAPAGPKDHLTALMSKVPYDVRSDFTPIIRVWGNPFGIVVRSDSEFKTMKDLIEYARAHPGELKHMSAGIGTGPSIIMTQLEAAAGVKFTHVPGKSGSEAATSLLGGHVDVNANAMGAATPLIQAGKLRLLATLGEERSKVFPDVPTLKELGYNVVYVAPMGLVGPKVVPKEIIKTLHDGFKEAMAEESFLKHCEKFGIPILYMNTDEFKAYWREGCEEWEFFYNKYIRKN